MNKNYFNLTEPINFRNLEKRSAKEFYEAWIEQKDEKISWFLSQIGFGKVVSFESIEEIQSKFLKKVRRVEKPKTTYLNELRAVAVVVGDEETAKKLLSPWDLTPDSYLLAYNFAMLLGKVFIKEVPNTKWFIEYRRSEPCNTPVVGIPKKSEWDVITYSLRLAYDMINKRKLPDTFEVFEEHRKRCITK